MSIVSDFIIFLTGAAIGGLFSEIIFKPFVELRRLRTDVVTALREYSGYFLPMPASIPLEQRQKASEAICRLASGIHPFVADAPMYGLVRRLFWLPPKENFERASAPLTRLSNFHASYHPTDLFRLVSDRQEVCELLGRPLPSNERRDSEEITRLLKDLSQH